MTYTYSDLHFYEWMLHELKKQPNSKPEKVEALIIDMKRQLRANSKRVDDRQIVRDELKARPLFRSDPEGLTVITDVRKIVRNAQARIDRFRFRRGCLHVGGYRDGVV